MFNILLYTKNTTGNAHAKKIDCCLNIYVARVHRESGEFGVKFQRKRNFFLFVNSYLISFFFNFPISSYVFNNFP